MENNNQTFRIIPALLKELEAEAVTTRKMLALVPDDQHGFKPHERSMLMKHLAIHIAELPSWIKMALETDGLDFATQPYAPTEFKNNAELLEIFERSYAEGHAALAAGDEADFMKPWILRNGEMILADLNKFETIRMAYSQTTHHRAQLGVYLRLLDIKIPGSYGPSADGM